MLTKSTEAVGLIRRILRRPPEKRHVSPRQLHDITDQLFPHHIEPNTFSVGWNHALEVAILARHCTTTPDSSSSKTKPQTSTEWERHVLVEMLNRGRFPVKAWDVPARLLQRWRDLSATSSDTRTNTFQSPSEPKPLMFPSFQSVEAAKEMMLQLSFAHKGIVLRREPWLEALQLYDETIESLADPRSTLAAQKRRSVADQRDQVQAAALKRMRHILQTTLLDADRWEDALRVFMHALYQRDMPGHITTGYLIQRLGERGCWEDVLRIYNLSARLITARAHTPAGAPNRQEGREWGTAFSLAMDAVSRHDPHMVRPMVAQLAEAAPSRPLASGVTQLDGHFLAAVQRLPSTEARLEVLRLAKDNNLLDSYKLIRGLVSRGRWLEALSVFCDATLSPPTGSPALSRKELGQSRLHLLHASTAENVERVVATLQNVRYKMNSIPTVARETPSFLKLNDAEAECVLSKALQVQEGSGGNDTFWQFGLAVLRANYPAVFHDDSALPKHTGGTPRAPTRMPSITALSLFFHDPHLPWRTALFLAQQVDQPHAMHPNRNGHRTASATEGPSRGALAAESALVTPSVLLWNAVADLLTRQGQGERGFDLFSDVMRRKGTSPSAAFLLRCPVDRLGDVLASVAVIDGRVLYHLLHTTPPRATNAAGRPRDDLVAVTEGGLTWYVPKSFWILSTWMAVKTGKGFLTPSSTKTARPSPRGEASPSRVDSEGWLDLVPASVHCEVLKKLQSPHILIADQPEQQRCALLVRYLRRTLHQMARKSTAMDPCEREATREAEQGTTQRIPLQRLQKAYSIAFEAVLGLLSLQLPQHADHAGPSLPPTEDSLLSSSDRVSYACDVLSAVTTQVHYLPPTHLLLPQPLGRLLPRFDAAAACCDASCADRVMLASHLLRCCYSQLLAAQDRPAAASARSDRDVARLPQYREPALYHALLKLCCRLAEYDSSRAQGDSTANCPRHRVPRHRAGLSVPELIVMGCHLIQWQEAQCGLGSIGEATLILLYNLCASASTQNDTVGNTQTSALGSHAGTAASPTTPWQHALAVTRYLAGKSPAATHDTGAAMTLPLQRQRGEKWLTPRHWHTYKSLFGWSHGLAVWYSLLPDVVLNDLSANAEAVNYCLGLEDRDGGR